MSAVAAGLGIARLFALLAFLSFLLILGVGLALYLLFAP